MYYNGCVENKKWLWESQRCVNEMLCKNKTRDPRLTLITCKPAQVLAWRLYHVQDLHSTLQYSPHNVSCISREWSRVRPSKSSSGSYQELGQRSWSAAGASDWNAPSSIALNANEQIDRTTLEGTGLVPREAYAVCLLVSSIPLTLLSSWIGIPYDAAGTFELWGGCCTFLLRKP